MTDPITPDPGQGNTDPDPGAGGESWLDSLPEDLKGSEHLKDFDGVEALAKAHVEKASEPKPVIPDSPDGYEIKIPEGMEPDESAQGLLKAKAHEAGMNQSQVDAVMDVYKGMVEEAQNDYTKQLEEGKEETITELKTDWGPKFDENLALAKKAASVVFDDEFCKFIDDSGLGNHPKFVHGLLKIGQSISEDVLKTGSDKSPDGERLTDSAGRSMLNFSKSMGDD